MTPGSDPGAGPDAVARIEHLLILGRYDLAAAAAGQARATAPSDPRLLVMAAWAQLGLADLDGAVQLARAAAVAAPHSDLPFGVLAEALGRAGRHEEAAYAAYRAVELDPDDWRNHVRYSQRLAPLPDQADRAWEAARHAVRLAPGVAATHAQIADLALREGITFASPEHLELAETALDQALRCDPGDATLLNDLGRVRAARHGWVAGLEGFARSVAADPAGAGRIGRGNIAVVVRTELYRLGWALVCACFVPVLGLGAPANALVAAIAVGYAVRTVLKVRAGGEHAWRAVRSTLQPSTMAASALLALGLGALVTAAVAPSAGRAAGAVGWLAGVCVVAVIAVTAFARGPRADD